MVMFLITFPDSATAGVEGGSACAYDLIANSAAMANSKALNVVLIDAKCFFLINIVISELLEQFVKIISAFAHYF